MNNTGRKATGVLMGVLAGLVAGQASAQDSQNATSDDHRPTIVLHVVNYAAVPGVVLTQAMKRVETVYDFIGVRIVWLEGQPVLRQHQDDGLHLSILLLSPEMSVKKISAGGIADNVLGQAHLPSGRAHIFCERIASAHSDRTLIAITLGSVIAHEVGHLVLPEIGHSPHGIMSAAMNMHTTQLATFNGKEGSLIRMTLLAPAALVASR